MDDALIPVKAWYDAISAEDWTTLRNLVDLEMEFVVADGFPAGGRYVGPDAIFDTFFPASFAAWSSIAPEVDEIFAVAADNVVVRGRYVGRTKATGTPFNVPFAHLWRARGGKLVWLQQYIDTAVLRDAIEGRPATAVDETNTENGDVMSPQTSDLTREQIIERNLAAVDVHFHNENPEGIDRAVGVYTDDIVWEVPARGLVLRDRETVKQEYLKIFEAMKVHKITNLHRFATEEWVFDDSIFEVTLLTDGFRNCPFPAGTHCSIRLVHAFQCRDGEICRENGYEIWRRADDTVRVRDDIPAGASVEVFD